MAILKHIVLTGESTESWAQAGRAAVQAAQQTLRNVREIEVTRLTARVEGDGELVYQATVNLSFEVEQGSDDGPLALQQAVEIVSEERLS
jgi:flavin-binding protein dodecin